MYNIKKFPAYALLVISTIFIIKTLPSALHEILAQIHIHTNIGMDVYNCKTIFNSILKTGFEYRLFYTCLISFFISLIILLRQRTYSLSLLSKNYNIAFSLGFFIFLFINFCNFYAVYDFLTSNTANINVFDRHIIYNIIFGLAFIVFILFSCLYLLIWFDNKLNTNYKIIMLIAITCFSFTICTEIMTFNLMWGFVHDPADYFKAFDHVLSNLGLTIFCIEDNSPCTDYLKNMKRDCETFEEMSNFPKIPGGPPLY